MADSTDGQAKAIEPFLTKQEAAKILGVHPGSLCRMPIPFYKIGKWVRYRISDLEEYIDSRRVDPLEKDPKIQKEIKDRLAKDNLALIKSKSKDTKKKKGK